MRLFNAFECFFIKKKKTHHIHIILHGGVKYIKLMHKKQAGILFFQNTVSALMRKKIKKK